MSPTARYTLFWGLGMAAGSLAGLVVLRRRGGVSAGAVAAIALAWLGVLLGSKIQFRLEVFSLPEAFALSWWDLVAGGRRLPLGLYTGLLLAGLWCWITAAPWRAVGDALAVAYSVFIPIGRLGCLSFGCCMGTVCALWGGRWCPRFPPGSEAYNQQLRDGLIGLDATASLPAHPLPVYFALASLLTVGVLLWELRRHAPAGTLLATFCVLRPAAKLALEPLRADPSPSPLMTLIPLAALGCTLAVIGGIALRRLMPSSVLRRRAATLALALALAAPLGPRISLAGGSGDALAPEWAEILGDYMQNPRRGRRALLKAGRHGRGDVPPLVLLAMADARLRQGQRGIARRLFEEVAYGGEDGPWVAWAELGLGWTAALEDDPADARRHFARVDERDSASRPLAMLLVALLDSEGGWRDEADQAFASIVDDPAAEAGLRQTAALGRAYLAYWAEDYEQAAAAFDQSAFLMSGSPLWDDARYGGAVARWHAGEEAEARAELRALAHMSSPRIVREETTSALLDLERRAFMRSALARYRHEPVRIPEQQVTALLDRDGPALARARLAAMGEKVEAPRVVVHRVHRTKIAERSGGSVSRQQRRSVPRRNIEKRSPYSLKIIVGVLLVGAGLVGGIARRRGSKRHDFTRGRE